MAREKTLLDGYHEEGRRFADMIKAGNTGNVLEELGEMGQLEAAWYGMYLNSTGVLTGPEAAGFQRDLFYAIEENE